MHVCFDYTVVLLKFSLTSSTNNWMLPILGLQVLFCCA